MKRPRGDRSQVLTQILNERRYSVVDIETQFDLDSPEFEPLGGKIFSLLHTHPDRPWGPLSQL